MSFQEKVDLDDHKPGYDGFSANFVFGGPTLGFPTAVKGDDVEKEMNIVTMSDYYNSVYPNVYDYGF